MQQKHTKQILCMAVGLAELGCASVSYKPLIYAPNAGECIFPALDCQVFNSVDQNIQKISKI